MKRSFTLRIWRKLVKEQAQKIVQSESLVTIGKTAGMVGHDIRNPLQSIVSELYLAKTQVEELSDDGAKKNLKESIASIEEQIFYINKIVADLQDIARTTNPQMAETNVEKTIKEVLTSIPLTEHHIFFSHRERFSQTPAGRHIPKDEY